MLCVPLLLLVSSRARADSPPSAAPGAAQLAQLPPPVVAGTPATEKKEIVAPGAPPTTQPFSGSEWGATGETVFEHTRAALRDPHFGMRLYCDQPVPGTLHTIPSPTAPGANLLAGAPNGRHLFWDVSFGERMPIFTWFNVNPKRARYARGVQFDLDAAAFMLLDFSSQSAGVIDTDFRLGGSIDLRPWADGWEHMSLSVGFFHESTHLGDEYVLSAATIQANAVPSVNTLLPYRANPSYEALPVTLSLDFPLDDSRFSLRAYGGATAYFWSALPNGAYPSEWRAGGELRWTSHDGQNVGLVAPETASLLDRIAANVKRRSTGVHRDQVAGVQADRSRQRRGTFGFEAAYELLAKRRYDHVGPDPGPATFVAGTGSWYTQHAMLIGLYNLDTERSSSNAVGLSIDWIRGRSPFGQLTEYTRVDALAIGFEYYW